MAYPRKPKFVREQLRPVYRSNYKDQVGNKWLLRVEGRSQAVRDLVKKGLFRCYAERLSQETAAEEAEMLRQEHQRRLVFTAEQPPSILHSDLPARKLRASIVKPANPAPHRIVFEVDPRLTAQDNFDSHSLGIETGCVGTIDYTANGGTVRVTVEGGPGQPQQSSGSQGRLTIQSSVRAVWRVNVVLETGEPTYSLTGNLIVNA